MNTIEIIKGCKSQDLKAQRLLYEMYSKRLFPICVRYCKDQQSASSALHSGFLKIFKNISSLTEVNKLEAWMRRIIVHASIDQLQSDKKFSFVEVNDDHFEMSADHLLKDEISEKYLPLLNELPDGYRLVFSMRILEEMPHKEIAKILNISENTSRTQLMKARKMLKKIIDRKHALI